MTHDELMAALARLRDDATKLEPAIHKHTAAALRDPATHASWQRMGRVVQELRMVLAAPVPSTIARLTT